MTEMLLNAATPLSTPTYDGSGQTVHPSVLDFGQGLIWPGHTSWNGYRYWMGITPFPSSDANYENPSLLCSNDGLTWAVPDGLVSVRGTQDAPATGQGNPLIYPGYFNAHVPGTTYLADPELTYDPVTNRIFCHFITVGMGLGWRLIIINGDLTCNPPIAVPGGQCHCVQLDLATNTWHGWQASTVTVGGVAHRIIHRTLSSDGITWDYANRVRPEPHPWASRAIPLYPAHFNCTLREDGNTVDFIVATSRNTNGTTPPTGIGTPDQLPMFHARTYLDDPTRWEYPILDPVLNSGGTSKWDYLLYRQGFTISEDTKLLRMWYSARSNSNVWRTGYTEGVLLGLPDLPESPPEPVTAEALTLPCLALVEQPSEPITAEPLVLPCMALVEEVPQGLVPIADILEPIGAVAGDERGILGAYTAHIEESW